MLYTTLSASDTGATRGLADSKDNSYLNYADISQDAFLPLSEYKRFIAANLTPAAG